jgi:hypothetical protein
MKGRRNISLSLIVAPIVIFGATISENVSGSLWQKGLDAAHQSDSILAMSCLKQAFRQGMTDDSLYYLGAEVYLYKGVLDTALALNYAIKLQPASDLRILALRQRYGIYVALGWKAEAKDVMDSLGTRSIFLLQRCIPECNLSLSGGGYYENSVVDRHYPYPRAEDSTSHLKNGNGMASLRVGWSLSTFHLQEAQFGASLRYSGSRFSLQNSSANNMDSTDAAAGAYARYSFFSDQLSVGYAFSEKSDFLNNKSYVHECSIRAALLFNLFRGSVSLGYQQQYLLNRQYYYFMFVGDRDIDKNNTLGFMTFFSGFFANEVADSLNFIYVKNSTVYFDSTYTTPLRGKLDIALHNPFGYICKNLPMSCFSANPQVRFEHRFNPKTSGGAGLGYNVTWYSDNYKWYDQRYPEGGEPQHLGTPNNYLWGQEKFLAQNWSNRRLYWVRSISSVSDVILDSLPVIIYEKQRIDQAISLNLFIQRSIGRWGDLTLDATAQRNFSTLMNNAPVDIQRWYAALMLTWDFNFRPDNKK